MQLPDLPDDWERPYQPETTYQEDEDRFWAEHEAMDCGQISDSLSQEDFENRRSEYGY